MSEEVKNPVKQEQIQDLVFGREISWQEIIYDLINTEQLDPWDINITILTDKYLEKIKELENADFFISSKVLLAASFLLRIKSEILLSKYIKSIDEILFGKKEEKKSILERIELDEEIPELIPRSPMPRMRRVTLQELMESLNKAIVTENRRIKKEIISKNALRETAFSLPKSKYSLKDKIKEIYSRLIFHFNEDEKRHKIAYNEFTKGSKEERVISFSPLLHLENHRKVWLDQEKHFDEIYIWLKENYLKHNPDPLADLKAELQKEMEELSKEDSGFEKRIKKVNKDFENPMADLMDKEMEEVDETKTS